MRQLNLKTRELATPTRVSSPAPIETVTLPTEPSVPLESASKGEVGIIVGAPGVGKSWFLCKIPNVLVLELDPEGLRYVDWPVAWMQITSVAQLRGAITQLIKARDELKYETIAIDSLTTLEQMLQEEVSEEFGQRFDRIGHGSGWVAVRTKLIKIINATRRIEKRIIFTAHNTKLLFDNEAMVTIELSGKAKNLVGAAVDWIGYLRKDEDGIRVLDFRHNDVLEFKSRNPFLAGKIIKPAEPDVFFKACYGQYEEPKAEEEEGE